MNNAWLVRPYPHEIKRLDEFKQMNIVAIGWPGIGDLTGKSRSDLKNILSDDPYNLSGLQLGNAYATVDIFVNQMQVNDYILVPDGDDIYFCQISGDYYLDETNNSEEMGFPHQRNVTWLSSTVRKNLSNPLRSSLKVHRTTADLTKHYNEIKALACGDSYSEDTTMVNVTYPLRPDCNIAFSIPANISKTEAKRLSLYFETLYYTE